MTVSPLRIQQPNFSSRLQSPCKTGTRPVFTNPAITSQGLCNGSLSLVVQELPGLNKGLTILFNCFIYYYYI